MKTQQLLRQTFFGLGLCLGLLSGAVHANEALVKKAVEAKLEGAKIDSVTKTPYLGLYEVRFEGQLVYTDEKVSYIFAGNIIDGKTMQNLTQERLRKLSVIKFSDLPLEQSVKIVRGNGRREIAYFSDPNCGYCKRFEKDLASMTDITVYTFLYPILSPDSVAKAKAVWCSSDRVKTWNDMMLNGITPAGNGTCDTPIEKTLALGQKLNVTGTPTIFLKSGERIPGAIPVAQLEKALSQADAKTQ